MSDGQNDPATRGKGAQGHDARDRGAVGDPITIKKYANRRLYNTASSSYVTLEHLSQMVRDGIDFAVFDAKSGQDITRSVLTQIIVEEEAKHGQNLLPTSFLRSLIGYYGDNMHRMMLPQFLDLSIRSFSENQEKMQDMMQGAFGSVFPFGQMEELGKQNMAMFENAMRMFSPFAQEPKAENAAPPSAQNKASDQAAAQQKVDALQRQLTDMQEQLKAMQTSKE